MNVDNVNTGVSSTGPGDITIGNGNEIGGSFTVHGGTARETDDRGAAGADTGANALQTDIGVITVLSSEARAVIGILEECQEVRADGVPLHRGHVGDATVVMAQMERQGNRSTSGPFQLLRAHFDPGVILLVGIGGGIHKDVRRGDVVIGQEVIYYDLRKETPTGVRRRSEGHQVPAWVRREVNSFFTRYGEPYVLPCGTAKTLTGPVGSGEAVIADADSPIRRDLTTINDKALVVDTEAGGLALDFHTRTGGPRPHGWLVIRGISDTADVEKNDADHRLAAGNAALVLRRLIPCLASALRHQA